MRRVADRLEERKETGADEHTRGSSRTLRRIRRCALLVVVLSVAALAWSCVFHGTLTRKPVGFLTTNDAVIALRLGRGWTTVAEDKPYYDGWIVLLDAQGRGQVASVDEVLSGDVLWSDRGVFFGSPSHDYVMTDSATQEIARKYVRDEDVSRYELSGGTLAVVKEEGTGYRVDSVHPDGTTSSVESSGVRGNVGQCGSRILSITDTKESPGISAAAFAAHAARSGDEVSPTALAAVVQLNDHDGEASPVLAVAPMIGGLESRQHMFACEGDIITMPGVQADDTGVSSNGATSERQRTLVLQRWDLSTGERSIIPVLDVAGNPLALNDEQGGFRVRGNSRGQRIQVRVLGRGCLRRRYDEWAGALPVLSGKVGVWAGRILGDLPGERGRRLRAEGPPS